MVEHDVEFKIDTFPSSETFRIFRVYNNCIWQIISVPAYNIDTGYSEYYDLSYDDPVTTEIICSCLNEEERRLNG